MRGRHLITFVWWQHFAFPVPFLRHSLWMCIGNFANNCTHGRLLPYMQSAVKKKLNSQPHFVMVRRMRSSTNLSSQVFQLVDFSATKLYTNCCYTPNNNSLPPIPALHDTFLSSSFSSDLILFSFDRFYTAGGASVTQWFWNRTKKTSTYPDEPRPAHGNERE